MAGRKARVQVSFIPDAVHEQQQEPQQQPPDVVVPAAAEIAVPQLPTPAPVGDKAFFDAANPSAVHAANVEPLPPDGRIDDQPAFGAEYTMRLLRNRAIISADAVYRFVEELGGLIGLTSVPWTGKAGGQAVGLAFDNAFSNLAALANTTMKPILDAPLTNRINDDTKKMLEKGLSDIRTAAETRAGLSEEAKQVAGDLLGNVHARRELDILERQVKLVKAASDLPDDRVGATVNRALGVGNLGGTPGVRVASVGPAPPGSASVPKGGAPSTALPVHVEVETQAALLKRAKDKLEAQRAIATNPEIVLYRAMEEGRVTDAWYKAYNRLYYNDTGENSLAKLSKFTEAVRSIERLLVSAGSARGNFSPANLLSHQLQAENLGVLFIDSKVRVSILGAYEDLKNVALVQNIPLVEWMVQDGVRFNFMRLCALTHNDPIGRSYAARGSTMSQRDRNADDRNLLLNLLKTATYVGTKLVLARTYDPMQDRERAMREAILRRDYEQTGEYNTGRITALKIHKGPKGDLAEERKQRQREAEMAIATSILFS